MSRSLQRLLGSKEIVIACGPGGVGKTTTAAAAAAIAAARMGGEVLVLTVDPARRLADALGLKGLGNEVAEVPRSVFEAAGEVPTGRLFAAMLDTKQSWDALIATHAPDEETKERILSNPLYQNITERFVQSHDYIAMERLWELHSSGRWDLIVVDTPPTRNALDFLDAPARLAEFFSSRLLRWLIAPKASTLVGMASKPFTQVADRILGTQFLADITDFFMSLQSMYDGFVERSKAVTRLLSDERTTFMVVSSSETVPLREAEFFATELERRDLDVGAVVLNRILPSTLSDDAVAKAAHRIAGRSSEKMDRLARVLDVDPSLLDRVLGTTVTAFEDYAVVARREAGAREQFPLGGARLITVPQLEGDVGDMSGLLEIGRCLLGS